MRRRLILVVAVALLALAGCGAESSAATLAGTLTYVRSGGFVGARDGLTIHPNGRAKVSTRRGRRSFTLSGAERGRVAKGVAKADFAHLNNIRRAGGRVADAYGYELHYRGHVVSFDDTTIPAQAKDLLAALARLVEVHGPH